MSKGKDLILEPHPSVEAYQLYESVARCFHKGRQAAREYPVLLVAPEKIIGGCCEPGGLRHF